MVTHLAAGTPISALHKASGVQSPEALGRYAEFVPDLEPLVFRRAMRDAGRPGRCLEARRMSGLTYGAGLGQWAKGFPDELRERTPDEPFRRTGPHRIEIPKV